MTSELCQLFVTISGLSWSASSLLSGRDERGVGGDCIESGKQSGRRESSVTGESAKGSGDPGVEEE
jgi:hypothetical protein